jgi:nicotinate-nucleotide adenylyltransferase
MTAPARVALIGGSFNPPHVGHLLAAHFVRAATDCDQVWLVPSHRHPFGKPLQAFEHRVAMCQLLCEDASGWLGVSEAEREVGGEGRTVDLLEHLVAASPETRFTLVIGSDILADLPHWKDVPRIEQLATILVLNRAGHPSPRAFGPPLAEVSSTHVRDLLARGEDARGLVPRKVLEYVRARRLYSSMPTK